MVFEADFRGLADTHNRGALDITEFTIAMHLIQSLMTNQVTAVPTSLPPDLISAAGIGSPITGQFSQNGVRRTESMSSTGSGRLPPQLPPKIQQTPLTADVTGSSQAGSAFEGWDVTPQDKMQFDNLFKGIDTSNKGYVDGIPLQNERLIDFDRQRSGDVLFEFKIARGIISAYLGFS